MKYRVKKRYTILGIGMVAVISSLVFYTCFQNDDKIAYQNVLQRANPSLAMEIDTPYKASQRRKGVQKILWHTKNAMRLCMIIDSRLSDLVYEKVDGNQEIVEHMEDVNCRFQEEVFYLFGDGTKVFEAPLDLTGCVRMQTIRFVLADKAKYFYHSGSLLADRVKIKVFTIPGHDIPASFDGYEPIMVGTAQMIEMSFVDKELIFKAGKLKVEEFGHGKIF